MVDGDLVLKTNRIVILSDLQNHVIHVWELLKQKNYSDQKYIFLN